MIGMSDYTYEEVDAIYSALEDAVREKQPIDMHKIDKIVKTGDFYLAGSGSNGLHFTFNGSKMGLINYLKETKKAASGQPKN